MYIMIRVVRQLSTKNGEGIKDICKLIKKDIWKDIPDYDLDVNPYEIENKHGSKDKKDEKNKSNT